MSDIMYSSNGLKSAVLVCGGLRMSDIANVHGLPSFRSSHLA